MLFNIKEKTENFDSFPRVKKVEADIVISINLKLKIMIKTMNYSALLRRLR
jgi:hypothetical protein